MVWLRRYTLSQVAFIGQFDTIHIIFFSSRKRLVICWYLFYVFFSYKITPRCQPVADDAPKTNFLVKARSAPCSSTSYTLKISSVRPSQIVSRLIAFLIWSLSSKERGAGPVEVSRRSQFSSQHPAFQMWNFRLRLDSPRL